MSSLPAPLTPWRAALTGMLSLGVAMGVGRFAFTPLLPMMLHDGVVDLPTASWLASANYLGYMLGALLCMVQPWIWRRLGLRAAVQATAMVRLGLAATCVFTLGMALPWPPAWPALRFGAGVASALVFVYVSAWSLGQLARLGQASMGALIYVGPGGGIVLTGLAASAMVATGWRGADGWMACAALSLVLTALVWPVLGRHNALAAVPAPTPAAAGTIAPGAVRHGPLEITLMATAYVIAGFGYIITATFLPVIARQALPGSPWLDLFWPILGVGVMAGAAIASRVSTQRDLRLPLAACFMVQALGIGVGLLYPTLAGFVIGSLLVGLPFTSITYFSMQETRRVKPHATAVWMGLMTALYGLGQIVGPPMTAAILRHAASTRAGFDLALEIAAGSLLLGGALHLVTSRLYPLRRAA